MVLPQGSVKSDWEVELGVVIGSTARYVSRGRALEHVAGYCVVNDVSEREFQLERGGTGTRARAATPSARSAPGWSPPTRSRDPQNLAMWLDVNGQRMQNGNTSTMIFGVAQLVSYLSRFMTLLPGDLSPPARRRAWAWA